MFFLLIISGLFVGVMSSFFGVGGGVLIVPSLYALFEGIHPQTVIGTSLTLICVNSALNSFNFYRAGRRIPVLHQLVLSVSMAVGVLEGSSLINQLSPKNVKIFFGFCLLLISIRTLLQREKKLADKTKQSQYKFLLLLGLSSALGGLISGMTGLGGGAILVPLLITVVRLPYKDLSLYSNLSMFGGTFVGAISYMSKVKPNYIYSSEILNQTQVGHVNLMAVALLFTGSFLTSKLGVKLNDKVDPIVSKRLFCALLLFIALRILLKTLTF